MVSKADIQDELDKTRAEQKDTLDRFEAVCHERDLLRREIRASEERELRRMRADHTAEQHRLREAEREDKRKRRTELADGMLRMRDATEWAIVADEHGKVLELTVPLTDDIEPIVHGVLTKTKSAATVDRLLGDLPGARPTYSRIDEVPMFEKRMQDSINRIREHLATL